MNPITLKFRYQEQNETWNDYYHYLMNLITKLPDCKTKDFFIDRLIDINNDPKKHKKKNDTYILWDAVRNDLFSYAQDGDERTFALLDGDLVTGGDMWEKIIPEVYCPELNCFTSNDDPSSTEAICACGNKTFKVRREIDSIWSIHITCTKCGKDQEYASE